MSFCFNQIPFYLNESEFGEANNDGESPIDEQACSVVSSEWTDTTRLLTILTVKE